MLQILLFVMRFAPTKALKESTAWTLARMCPDTEVVPLIDTAIRAAVKGHFDTSRAILNACMSRRSTLYYKSFGKVNVGILVAAVIKSASQLIKIELYADRLRGQKWDLRKKSGAVARFCELKEILNKFFEERARKRLFYLESILNEFFSNWEFHESTKSLMPELIQLAQSENYYAKFAEQALAKIGGPEATPILLNKLSVSSPIETVRAACALSDIRSVKPFCNCLLGVTAELDRLRVEHPYLSDRQSNFISYGTTDYGRKYKISRLEEYGKLLIEALATLKSRDAISPLEQLLPRPDFGFMVFTALSKIDSYWDKETSIKTLTSALKSDFGEIRAMAIRNLRTRKGPIVLDALIGALNDKSVDLRWAAGDALRDMTEIDQLDPVANAMHAGTLGSGIHIIWRSESQIHGRTYSSSAIWQLQLGLPEKIVYYTNRSIRAQTKLTDLIECGISASNDTREAYDYEPTLMRLVQPEIDSFKQLLRNAVLSRGGGGARPSLQ
ncbi:MAG: HEAT repeat domain-containing protein [Candidatus Accumulibacter sp.]|uniref:HEAT repeat domain-containing protein n=1 Tax=Candidatus Accumulibacter affinis TaxID=2954384 RepID=A0A935TAU6_9PROT|nr:HEAT repeat domain-containing protein [Candidatus Accumulibacter affinis]